MCNANIELRSVLQNTNKGIIIFQQFAGSEEQVLFANICAANTFGMTLERLYEPSFLDTKFFENEVSIKDLTQNYEKKNDQKQ